MKLTMLTIGSTGDVTPFILLGSELASRGHTVTIAAFASFQNLVEQAGLHFFPLSGSAEEMIGLIMKPGAAGVTYLSRLEKGLRQVSALLVRDLDESCRGADAMICNFFGSVYNSIAEKYDIPCIQTRFFPMDPSGDMPIPVLRNQHLGPVLNRTTFALGYLLISLVEKRYLSAWRQENRVTQFPMVTRPRYQVSGHPVPVIYAVSPHVLPRPVDWPANISMSGYWFDSSPVSFTPPPELASFVAAGEPPVYIGYGSMNGGDMNRLMAITLHAVHAAGLRAVVSLGWSGERLKSTKNVFFADFIPHAWLFPRVQAIVHHGGAGTTAAGLRFGRPTLVVPFNGDQYFWAERVYRLGCGPKSIPRDRLTVQRLTGGLLDLTGKAQYRDAAQALSVRLAEEDGTRTAADLIEQEISRWQRA